MNVNFTGKANFGPFVASYRAHPELIEGLKERGLKGVPGSGNQDLAGILKDQRGYSMEDKTWFCKEFQPYITDYSKRDAEFRMQDWANNWTDKFNLMSLWINYMKPNEYNPNHTHNGQLTWVIYLETPNEEELEKERAAYKGRSFGPGGICFHYGEPTFPEWNVHTFGYVPKVGEMWIFPAMLRHEVIPFTASGTRISVSGNLFFKNPNEESSPIPMRMDAENHR